MAFHFRKLLNGADFWPSFHGKPSSCNQLLMLHFCVRKRRVTFTLSPSSRKRVMLRILMLIASSVPGRNLISLICTCFAFSWLRRAFWPAHICNGERYTSLQTGGLAVGEISTKSTSCSSPWASFLRTVTTLCCRP